MSRQELRILAIKLLSDGVKMASDNDKKVYEQDLVFSVSNSRFIFVLDYKFWLVSVEVNKVNSLSKLKNAIKIQDLLLNGKFHLFNPSLIGLKFI